MVIKNESKKIVKIDMHTHSKEGSSCASIPIMETIKILKSKGVDGMLITDHESIAGFNSIKDKDLDGFKVFCGFEQS